MKTKTGVTDKTEEKQKRREARLKKDAEKFKENLKIVRPGFGPEQLPRNSENLKIQESLNTDSERVDLSGILWLSPEQLKENPYNEYPALSGEELQELARDIAEKGVLVPLIVRVSEDVLICGHNRKKASIEAKEPKVPVQRVLRLLTEDEEREIMRSENDRRRGGNWSKEKKVEFIQEHFGDRLEEDNRGAHKKLNSKKFTELLETENQKFNEVLIGDGSGADQDSTNLESKDKTLNRSSNDIAGNGRGKKFNELLETGNQNFSEVLKTSDQGSMNLDSGAGSLAKEIEKKSRGNITEGTAKRIVSEMRREKKKEKPPKDLEKEKNTLSEKERKRGEKLALHLKTIRQTKEKLEEKLRNAKAEEKRLLGELRKIGQPELFGVE